MSDTSPLWFFDVEAALNEISTIEISNFKTEFSLDIFSNSVSHIETSSTSEVSQELAGFSKSLADDETKQADTLSGFSRISSHPLCIQTKTVPIPKRVNNISDVYIQPENNASCQLANENGKKHIPVVQLDCGAANSANPAKKLTGSEYESAKNLLKTAKNELNGSAEEVKTTDARFISALDVIKLLPTGKIDRDQYLKAWESLKNK
jgi:hypothetical protein